MRRKTTAFHFLPKWSNGNQIYLLSWNNQGWTIYEAVVFKTLDIRQWKAVKPEDEKEEMSPIVMITKLTALKEFPRYDPWEETRVKPNKLNWGKSWFWKDEADGVCRTEYQRGRVLHRKELQKCAEGPVEYLAEYSSSMCRNYLRQNKEPLKRIRGKNAHYSHGTGIVASSHQADWKT